ncbi:MAG: sugar phosphate isomerase/epimerase [Clostridia bacterium]|nr:sugar phosphate isomerase/epimerase [Clostridia bacterium]
MILINQIGISSSCYYPQYTEVSFQKVCDSEAAVAEIFFNSLSELEPAFVKNLADRAQASGTRVAAVHPFGSFTEGFWLFSNYRRRYEDSLELCKKFFATMNILGAKIFVLHGCKLEARVDDDFYAETFASLVQLARQYGVIFAQENIVHYKSQSIEFLQKLKNTVGEDFRMVFDVKQARRAGVDAYDYLDKLGDAVCHMHVSDFNAEKDCIPPGEGLFDFKKLFAYMQSIGYAGDYMIELYNHSYRDETQIANALRYLKNL